MSIHDEAEKIRRKLEEENNNILSIALFGQPGAGKSSLINKIVDKRVAAVGIETDKTVEVASYEANGLLFVELPGYGTKNFPKENYFDRFNIQQFDLFLCVTSGKLHQADTEFFQELTKRKKVCIFVFNKHDQLWEDDVPIEELERRKVEDIKSHIGQPVKLIFTSCKNNTGLNELKELITEMGSAKREQWNRNAKAYIKRFLQEKRDACEKYVKIAATASASNGINPIPGADIAVDLSILLKLFSEIRESYGLSDDFLGKLAQSTIPIISQLASNAIQYATKEGILLLLKKYLGKQAAKSFSKYIPFVGQAIAVSIGYAITYGVGNAYLENCHNLAEEILSNKLLI